MIGQKEVIGWLSLIELLQILSFFNRRWIGCIKAVMGGHSEDRRMGGEDEGWQLRSRKVLSNLVG